MKRMKLERVVVAEQHKHGRSVAILVEFKITASAPALKAKRDCWSCVHSWCSPVRDVTVVSVDRSSYKICVSSVCSVVTFLRRRVLVIAEESSTMLVLAGRFGNKHFVLVERFVGQPETFCVPVCYRRLKDTSFPQGRPLRRE